MLNANLAEELKVVQSKKFRITVQVQKIGDKTETDEDLIDLAKNFDEDE